MNIKKELIVELLEKFENACYLVNEVECWSARELQQLLGYAQWRNFTNAIEKAKRGLETRGFR